MSPTPVRLGLQSGLLLTGFPIKMLYTFVNSRQCRFTAQFGADILCSKNKFEVVAKFIITL
jgi:hypothetical protein